MRESEELAGDFCILAVIEVLYASFEAEYLAAIAFFDLQRGEVDYLCDR